MSKQYEAVIGLEIHVQLLTKSKAFSAETTEYGALPNTQLSVINLAHPGTLPKHNIQAINNAIMLGLALNCDIRENNFYSRKNYFYADLPKGYQITQFDTPICENGAVDIKVNGESKKIRLTRIHMEEDTGKSMHDMDLTDSLIDYNRAGIPLVEIVTEPDVKNAEEAYQFITEVRKLVRYLGICDGNMEEGSLRCDANVSVKEVGNPVFGTKVEVKNMNSISNVKRAIEFEIERQINEITLGNAIVAETRGFNASDNSTFSMRKKEMVNDYRYFPEPDLPPLIVTKQKIEEVRSLLPELPNELFNKYVNTFKLTNYDAGVLTDDKQTAMFFNDMVKYTTNYKTACNWLTVNLKGYLNENAMDIEQSPITPNYLAEIINLIDTNKISHNSAAKILFPHVLKTGANPLQAAEELNLLQQVDTGLIETIVNEVLTTFADKVIEYKNGKKGLLGLFVGECMKKGQGKIDPKQLNALLNKKLEN